VLDENNDDISNPFAGDSSVLTKVFNVLIILDFPELFGPTISDTS
jgi:hypothetical protein